MEVPSTNVVVLTGEPTDLEQLGSAFSNQARTVSWAVPAPWDGGHSACPQGCLGLAAQTASAFSCASSVIQRGEPERLTFKQFYSLLEMWYRDALPA